jgi:hypothetical protein
MIPDMKNLRLLALTVVWLLPVASFAEKPDHAGKGPMQAAEKRSERAAERANSQWKDGAMRGQARAAETSEAAAKAHDEMDAAADEALEQVEGVREDADKAAKRAEKEAEKAAKRAEKGGEQAAANAADDVERDTQVAKLARPKQPRGFWARLFGGEESE